MISTILLPVVVSLAREVVVSPKGLVVRPRGVLPPHLLSLLQDQGEALAPVAADAWRHVGEYIRQLYGTHWRACSECRVDAECSAAVSLLALEKEALKMDQSKQVTPNGVVFHRPEDPALKAALQRFLDIEQLLDGLEAVDGQAIDPEERAFFAAQWFFDEACFANCQRFLQLAREARTVSASVA